MSLIDQFLWIIYPYLVIAVFVLGLIMRYNTDQIGWTSKSSELLEKRLLKWGSLFFHIGIIFAFLGHVVGLLIPLSFYRAIHVSDKLYRLGAAVLGGLAGLVATIGLLILLYRRFLVKRVRINSSTSDFIAIVLLVIVVLNGMAATISHAMEIPKGFDYRASIGPWLRGIITFTPNAALMAQAPMVFKFHVFGAFLFFALMPFSRMVHIISQPITYLFRSYIVYRKRA